MELPDMYVLGEWLSRIGLQRYREIFERNQVDLDILADLGEVDLEKLGISIGDRRRLMRAIEELRADRLSRTSPIGLQPVANEPGAHSGSRVRPRHVTAFYCDLVESTALSMRCDPEDLHDLIWQYRSTCQRTIEHYGGFVHGYEGDGIMVYFGYPSALEDSAECAVRAGIEVIDSLKALDSGTNLPNGASIRVRVGIATGEILTDEYAGEHGPIAHDLTLEIPRMLAARLQTVTNPNTMVVCPNTHALAHQQFEYRDLGVQTLNEFDKPIEIWQVLGIRSSMNPQSTS